MYVDVNNDSWRVWPFRGNPGKQYLVWMMVSSHKRFSITNRRTRDFTNLRPRRFLDENDVELVLGLKESVNDERVFSNILQKNFEVFHNHSWGSLFTSEWIDLDLLSQISAYFFCCHSLLNLCLQNRHWLESAWWSPRQFKHLNEWGHSSPFFVSNLRGLVLSFVLQHYLNSQWFSDLWEPLHLMHFVPWILHEKVTWSHFQQFLHWGTPGFMFASQIVTIYLLTLKYLLTSVLALLPLWTSQMSIHTIDMSDLGDTLITLGLDAKEMLSKIWFCLRIVSMLLDMRCSWELSWG